MKWLRRFSSSPTRVYERLRKSGALRHDAAQHFVVKNHLERLYNGSAPSGLYIYGSVGTGKSMLMDLLYENTRLEKKRRVHFHKFMLEVHQRVHEYKKTLGFSRHIDLRPERDAIGHVAKELANECQLLCFDEFQITDIADALIMRKLFGILFQTGTIVVATSNTAPEDLYRDGVNREYFLPFIDELIQHCDAVSMDSSTDHRELYQPMEHQYLYPLSRENDKRLDSIAQSLQPDELPKPRTISVMMGRTLRSNWTKKGIARFTFTELCVSEKGAADYKAICETCHTVIVSDIPILTMARHNHARRFITLIDEIYEHKTRFICTAAAPPKQLFVSDDSNIALEELCSVKDLRYAFRRAASRLHEMQSEYYLERIDLR